MEYGVILVDKRSQENKNRADHELIIKALDTILAELDKDKSLTKDDTISIARSVIKLTDYALQLSNGQIPGVSDEKHYIDLLGKMYLLISNELLRNEVTKLAAENKTCADCSKFLSAIEDMYSAIKIAQKYRNLAKYMENKNYKGNNNDNENQR